MHHHNTWMRSAVVSLSGAVCLGLATIGVAVAAPGGDPGPESGCPWANQKGLPAVGRSPSRVTSMLVASTTIPQIRPR